MIESFRLEKTLQIQCARTQVEQEMLAELFLDGV